MSFVDFKEVTTPTAGSNVKYGSQDLLEIMQILNGKTVSSRRPHIINPWRWDNGFDIKEVSGLSNPSSGYQTLYVDSTTHRLTSKDSSGNLTDYGTKIPYNRRWGSYQPVAPTTISGANVGILDGILTQHVPTGAGTNSVTFDTSEGVVMNLVTLATGAGLNAGLISPTGSPGIGRRSFGMKAEARFAITNTANGRLFFGFTSATALPNNAQPLATTDNGVIVGFNETGSGSTNFSIFHNDGSSPVAVDNVSTGIAKNTSYHTVGISWPAGGNVTVTFDSSSQTISTELPLTTANLFFNLIAQTSTTTAKTILIDYIYIEAEK